MRVAHDSWVDIVGVDVLAEGNSLCQLVLLLPNRGFGLVLASEGNGAAGEFEVLEVEIIELSLPSSIGLIRPDDVDRAVESDILLCEFEVLCHLFEFPQISRLIELVLDGERMQDVNDDRLIILRGLSWDDDCGLDLLLRHLFRWLDVVIHLFARWKDRLTFNGNGVDGRRFFVF